MSSNDYSSVTGGSLKLKGVKDSKVEKHKKKKRKRPDKPEDGEDSAAGKRKSTTDPKTRSEEDESILAGIVGGEGTSEEVVIEGEQHQQEQEQEQETPAQQAVDQRPYPEPPSPRTATARKTEAELRHEEQRRRRLADRLKREGTKTHKERVEDLNRYLSNLSEHHDMPRIGPG